MDIYTYVVNLCEVSVEKCILLWVVGALDMWSKNMVMVCMIRKSVTGVIGCFQNLNLWLQEGVEIGAIEVNTIFTNSKIRKSCRVLNSNYTG
jgi:hypothetical protein